MNGGKDGWMMMGGWRRECNGLNGWMGEWVGEGIDHTPDSNGVSGQDRTK